MWCDFFTFFIHFWNCLIKLGSKTSREALNVINEQKSVSDLVEIFMNFLGFFLTFIILLTQFVNVFIQFVIL